MNLESQAWELSKRVQHNFRTSEISFIAEIQYTHTYLYFAQIAWSPSCTVCPSLPACILNASFVILVGQSHFSRIRTSPHHWTNINVFADDIARRRQQRHNGWHSLERFPLHVKWTDQHEYHDHGHRQQQPLHRPQLADRSRTHGL